MFVVLLACALPLLSFVATKKPLTRWRLTFVQEAARGISPSSAFFLKDGEMPNRILTTCEESLFKGVVEPVLHTLHFSSVLAMCTLCRSSIMYSGTTWFTLKHDHPLGA